MNRRHCPSLLLMLLLAAVTLPAHSFPGGFGGGGGFQVQQRQHQGQRDRQFQQPSQPNQPYRRQDADPQGPNPQNPQRMSPDERRQLRRDLRDAGRDVYPRRDWQR